MTDDIEQNSAPKATDEEMLSDEQRANLQREIDIESSEESKEFEMTPEIEAMIMNKVQNINKYGTAFCSIDFNQMNNNEKQIDALKCILDTGLLGRGAFKKFSDSKSRIESWKQSARAWDVPNSKIWFNIVGRMRDIAKNEKQIKNTLGEYGIAITFDLNSFEELNYGSINDIEEPGRPKDHIRHTFSSHNKEVLERKHYFETLLRRIIPNKENKNPQHKTGSTYSIQGFVTPFRVAPALFTGIVLNSEKQGFSDNVIETNISHNLGKIDKLLPIYNEEGSLLWPKQMSYEEVKAFVEERDR